MFSIFKKKQDNSQEEAQQEKKVQKSSSQSHQQREMLLEYIKNRKKQLFSEKYTSDEANLSQIIGNKNDIERRNGFKADRKGNSPSIDVQDDLFSENNKQSQSNRSVFIEYQPMIDETIEEISFRFKMDKNLLMNLNQIENENDEIPKFLVVLASQEQRKIILYQSEREEILAQIESYSQKKSEDIHSAEENKVDDIQPYAKKCNAFNSNQLEKQQTYKMNLITNEGVIQGNLILSSYMISFEPSLTKVLEFEYQQHQSHKNSKHNKHHKQDQQSISFRDYQISIDLNDIVSSDIAIDNHPQSTEESHTEMILSIFLDKIKDMPKLVQGNVKNFMRVDFNAYFPDGVQKTFVHYIFEKLQYLIGRCRSNNEEIDRFTESYVFPPSVSVVKNYKLVRCDSFFMTQFSNESNLQTFGNQLSKLEIYPNLKELASDNCSYENGVILVTLTTSKKKEFVPPKNPILSKQLFESIVDKLPCYLQNNDWILVFNPMRHGFSYDQFLIKSQKIGPHVLVVRDRKNNIFGGFITEGWHKSDHIYGSGEAFLFSSKKNPEHYPRQYSRIQSFHMQGGDSSHLQLCNETGFAIGIDSQYALFIHHSFNKGSTNSTSLMRNNPLTEPNDFKIDTFEIWALDESAL